MKINEILTKSELENCKHNLPFGECYSEESIDYALSNHVHEMELKEYLMYRQLDILNIIATQLMELNNE